MRLVPVLLLATLVGACAPPRAVDVRIGEACWRCRRPILKAVLAAEYVAPTTGFASKFRTIHCMATWIAQQQDAPQSGVFYVRNYATNTWIPAERAVYVRTVVNPGTNERDYMAFERGRRDHRGPRRRGGRGPGLLAGGPGHGPRAPVGRRLANAGFRDPNPACGVPAMMPSVPVHPMLFHRPVEAMADAQARPAMPPPLVAACGRAAAAADVLGDHQGLQPALPALPRRAGAGHRPERPDHGRSFLLHGRHRQRHPAGADPVGR